MLMIDYLISCKIFTLFFFALCMCRDVVLTAVAAAARATSQIYSTTLCVKKS